MLCRLHEGVLDGGGGYALFLEGEQAPPPLRTDERPAQSQSQNVTSSASDSWNAGAASR